MRILFPPIGGSDPINAGHDGSWLHCCRHFQPDMTEIYLSADMLRREQASQLYSKTLEKLNGLLPHPIQLRMVERPELEKPQLLDAFYDDYETLLTDLHKEFPDAELLVNISSGTPAMKGCLIHLYHMLPFPITLIQVDGVHEEMVHKKGSRDVVAEGYDVDGEWENNLDNLPDAPVRWRIVKDEQQALRLRRMQLKTLVRHNEFYAAALLADDLGTFLSQEAKACLRAAADRLQLNLYGAGYAFHTCGYEGGKALLKHASEMLYQAAETTLTMQCDLERDDIAGCARKLTPVLFSLMISYMKKLGVDAAQFTDKDYRQIDMDKLKTAYPEYYRKVQSGLIAKSLGSEFVNLTHDILIKVLIPALPYDSVYDQLKSLREIEKNVRNDIAHKPVKLTEKGFIDMAKKTPQAMMEDIHRLFEAIDPAVFCPSFWQGYEEMKGFLLEKLNGL